MAWRRWAVLVLASLGALPAVARGETVNLAFESEADTYVTSAYRNSRHGGSTTLVVDGEPARIAFLRPLAAVQASWPHPR